jgi:microcystin-dependent protein
MATGVFSNTCNGSSGGNYTIRLEYTLNSQDTVNNVSNVTINQYLYRTDGYAASQYNLNSTNSWQESINGGQVTSGSGSIDTRNGAWAPLGSWTGNVGHNSDGTLAITLSGSFSMGNTTLTGGSVSGSWTLPTIPRASTITTFPNFNIGDTIAIVIDKKSVAFTQDISLYVGATFVGARTNVANSYNLVLTSPEQDIIYNAIPNSTSVAVTLYCLTYSGGTQIGSTQGKGATASVASSVVPTITSVTAAETVSAVSTAIGAYVQNLSKIQATINGAAGAKSSTISSYQIVIDGVSYVTSPATSDLINKSGSISITGTVTDSRGRTASKSITVNLLAYAVPNVTGFTISRANSDGSTNPMGTYAKVVSTGSVQSLINGVEKNTLTYTLYSRLRGAVPWTTAKVATLIAGLSLNLTNTIAGYAATSSYDFRLDITDKFNTTLSLNLLSTGQVTMSWGNNGVGIGKIWQQGGLDVKGYVYEDDVRLRTPSGIINPFAGGSAPAGWLLCDGTAISRTTYADLFAVISTTYGAGDSSTTFNLPNLKGRIPVGLDSSQTEFNTNGKTGGAKTHTLTSTEMPQHSHIQDAHSHTTPGTGHSQLATPGYSHLGGNGSWYFNSMASGTDPTTATNQNTGGGGAHNNLQPYLVLNYIIKY